MRGRTLTSAGRTSDAIRAYRDALFFAPDLPEAKTNLAWLLIEMGELEEAELHAQETAALYPAVASLERQPDQPRLLQALGRIYLASGQLPAARNRLADAYRLDPDLPGLIDDIAAVAARMR